MLVSVGEVELQQLDGANIPVNLFILELDDDNDVRIEYPDAKWELHGDLFLPRKGVADEGVIHYLSSSTEELRQLTKEYVLPHYARAHQILESLVKGQVNEFYYWD